MRYYSNHNRRSAPWGGYVPNSVVNKIILANVIVHLFKAFSSNPMGIITLLGLSPRLVVNEFFIWQPFTYMFLHANFMHIFFNMLMTWFLGTTLESVWGGQRFFKYYVACGLGGAAFSFIFSFNGPPVIGASGAVFGLYLAYAMLFPNNYVYVNFLFPVKAKYLVTFLAVVQLLYGIAPGGAGIAYFAHLGGMAAGLFFFKDQLRNTNVFQHGRRRWSNHRRAQEESGREQESAKIDSILDKIATKGYENLSTTEKRILENYSRQKKEDSE